MTAVEGSRARQEDNRGRKRVGMGGRGRDGEETEGGRISNKSEIEGG